MECGYCKATAAGWFAAVVAYQEYWKSPLGRHGDNDAAASLLKQVWRPWDWRMHAETRYAKSFLESAGRISSMMNGKVLTATPRGISYVNLWDYSAGKCKCFIWLQLDAVQQRFLFFLEMGI